MKKFLPPALIIIALCQSPLLPPAAARQKGDDSAKAWVGSALTAMGGEGKLRALRSVQFEGIGHRYFIEQSERPEGPWLVSYEQASEVRDLSNGRTRRTSQVRFVQVPQWSPPAALVYAGGIAANVRPDGAVTPGQATQAEAAAETLALAPERLLLNALDAADLRAERDAVLQDVPHHVVAFSLRGVAVRILLNANTMLPTAVETARDYPADIMWSVWGDVVTRTLYSDWTLEPGGIRYPHQWNVERHGMPYREFTVTDLKLNVATPDSLFAIPEDVRKAFAARPSVAASDLPLGRSEQPAREIAPGVVQIPGSWYVALVRQADGVVVIEAPISSGYSAKVLAEVARRFPGAPVKAVVSTSDAWPHFGGVREYVARGVPVYALDLNRPILGRLLAADYRTHPDALARAPRRAKLQAVGGKTVIGEGSERMELYPIRSESGERMLMVYFPAHKLLYASDLVQRDRDGSFFMPQYLSELSDAVAREKLAVQTVFAMHLPPTPWADITSAVTKVVAATPDASKGN